MKRRDFLAISGLSGFGLALASHTLLAQRTSTIVSPLEDNSERGQPLLHFVAVGDVGKGNQGQYAVAKAMNRYFQSNPFPFVLLAGDNIYGSGEIEKINLVFEKPYQDLLNKGVRFQAVLGNHDILTNNGEDELKYAGYNMPSRYYTFTQKTVQFFALDTNTNASWPKQLDWLEKHLASSQVPWKVVYGHHPLYSSGMHGSDRQLIFRLAPLFTRYNVQLYICGHDHNYERTKPIEGTTYIVCGAGSSPRPVSQSTWTAFSASPLSFASFNVYSDKIEIRAINDDGKIFDQVTLPNS